jgi:ferritin-like metal-binding protein YciE
MMKQTIDSLDSLLYEELRDLYDMEKQLTKALPKMAKKASSEELQEAIQEHLSVTNQQVERLERVFELLGRPAKTKTCNGMKGVIEEGREAMEEDAADTFRDVAIIGAAQRAEHYEIAAYGVCRSLAEKLSKQDVADLLQETLDEEKEADERLTEITNDILDGHEEAGEQESEQSEQEDGSQSRLHPAQMGTQNSRSTFQGRKKAS